MLDVFLDSLFDSLKILGLSFALYVLLSFFEEKVVKFLEKNNKLAPLFGSICGVIPQCGISVVSADLYTKHHITMGTIVAIFIACSDEALPILFSNFDGNWYMVFPLLAIKIVGGFLIGYLVDAIFYKRKKAVVEHAEHCEGETTNLKGCCGHELEENENSNPWHVHLVHPLLHSLKIFAYSFVVLFIFGTLMFYFSDAITSFLTSNYYFSPIYSLLIGLIPNCASSVLISNLYIKGAIPFGALVSGLVVNAGLGTLYLFKNKSTIKDGFIILIILVLSALILGYGFIWVKI